MKNKEINTLALLKIPNSGNDYLWSPSTDLSMNSVEMSLCSTLPCEQNGVVHSLNKVRFESKGDLI